MLGYNDNEQAKVLSEDVSTYVVQIEPSNPAFCDPFSSESLDLDSLKFDLCGL